MTDFNAVWLLVGLLVGVTAGIACMIAIFALGAAGRGRQTRRTAIAAWRGMRPLIRGWHPSAEQLDALDADPPAVITAYRALAQGWGRNDARWDVLIALLTYTRREALRYRVDRIRQAAEQAPPVRMVP